MTEKGGVLFRSWQVRSHFNSPTDELMLTDGVALPAPTSLSIAGAVHHVAIVVAFGEFLVYLVVQAVNNALIWTHNEREKSATQNVDALFSDSNCSKTTSEVLFLLSDLAAVNTQRSSTPHGRCRDMCTPSCDPWFHGVCPTCLLHDALIHRWWCTTPHGLQREIEELRNLKNKKYLLLVCLYIHMQLCVVWQGILLGPVSPVSWLCHHRPMTINPFSFKHQLWSPVKSPVVHKWPIQVNSH